MRTAPALFSLSYVQSANQSPRGIVNTFGSYQTYYESSMLTSSTPSAISWIGSIQAFLLLIVGALTGPVYDAGYFRSLLIVGSFMLVLGQMMLSLCHEYWQVLLAQAFCIGIGCGCLFVPSVAILSTYFTTKVAFAMGIAASGSSLGEPPHFLQTHYPGSLTYTQTRRRDIPHRLPQITTPNRLRMDDTNNRLPHPRHPTHPQPLHARPRAPRKIALSPRSRRLQNPSLRPHRPGLHSRLHGALHALLLRAGLRAAQPHHRLESRLLPPRNHELGLRLRPHHTQLSR